MRLILRLFTLLLACAAFGPPRTALAQTPTLEFAAGAGNPTGNGPSVANQVITFQNNTNNPSGNTFAGFTPITTATFSLSNQQYTLPTSQLSTGTGVAFGTRINTAGAASVVSGLFQTVNAIGSSANANYNSANGTSGGIDVTTNEAVEIFTSAQPLPATVPANARYQFADLTVTFNQPVVNPVVHVTGLGGTYGTFGFTTELDLVTSGVTLSKLNGSTELSVSSTQILNNAPNPGATTGSGGASGSVLVGTANSGITSVTFRLYLRPGTAGGAIHPNDVSEHVGDSWLISASTLTPAPVATPNALTFNNPGGTNSTDVSAGFAGTDSQPGTLTSLTLTTFPTNATSITVNGTKYTGAAAFNAASVAARTLATNGDGTLATGQTVAVDPTDGGVTAALPFTVTDVQGATSAAANLNITFTATSSGYVFEDVNYGGGAGRPFSTAGTSPRSGAAVELYNATTGLFVARTTTDATGKYSFATTANTGYTVRVVNSTVTSSRAGYIAGLLPVQTYNGTTSRVGGENPSLADVAANTNGLPLASLAVPGSGTPESLAAFNTANNVSQDFGYNFDLIVNTRDAGQGSLRQFVANSNALGGEASLNQSGSRVDASGTAVALPAGKETSIFMIPDGTAHAGLLASGNGGPASQLTAGVAVLTTASALTLTGANATNTVIDGSTQTFNIGDTATGTVAGTSTAKVGIDGLAVTAVNVPEVEISGNSLATVLDVEAASATVRGLAIHGGNSNNNSTLQLGASASATGYLVENIALGVTATGAVPGTNLTTSGFGLGVYANGGTGTVQNSFFGYTGISGIVVNNGTGTAGTTQITGNQFLQNGYTNAGGDGITFGDNGGSGPALVQGNLITNPNASGIQFETGSTSATQVLNNTITGAGTGGASGSTGLIEGTGISYLQRNGAKRGAQADLLSKNVITGSQAAGIVVGYGQQNVTISQNNTNGNGGLGIDLIPNANYYVGGPGAGAADYANGDGVTLNDGSSIAGAAASVPNKGLDYPIIVSATIVGTTLVVKGYSQPGVTAEFFLRDADGSNFGEGQTYLGGGVENGTGDLNTATTTLNYSGTINGLNQGSDNSNTARAYTFNLDISALTAAQLTALAANGVTATATLSGAGTSEFSGKGPVNTAPVPNTLSNAAIPNTSGATALSPGLSSSASGTLSNGTANSIAYYTVTSLAGLTSGTLTYNGTALTAGNIAATQITNPALLTYTPVAGYAGGPVSFAYTATDANGVTSTTNNNGGTAAAGAATYTIPVSQVADVTTTLAGPAYLNAGQPSGTYSATFTNNGPNPGASVTQQVTLPTGAALTAGQLSTIQAAYPGTTYTAATRVLYFTGAPAALANGAANTFSFAFTAPTATGSVSLASNVATATSQGANTAPDNAALALQVNAAAPNNCAPSYYDGVNSYSGLSADYYPGNYVGNPAFFFGPNGTTGTGGVATESGIGATVNYATSGANNGLGSFPITSKTVPTNSNASFSARYRGNLTVTTAGAYTFTVNVDDRAQLWLDGAAVPTSGVPVNGQAAITVSNYQQSPVSATLNLSAGKHNILLLFGSISRPDNINLQYAGPDNPTTGTIPNAVLCAGPSNVPPLAVGNTNAAIPGNAGPTALSPSLAGTDQDGTVTSYMVNLPSAAQGVLYVGNQVLNTANFPGLVLTAAQAAQLKFAPTPGFVGNAAFTFSAIDNSNQYSNDVATYTIPVTAAADVTTTLTGPTTLNSGQPSGSYTATFTNNGPNPGASVTQRVTLPAGVTNVVLPTGATLTGSTIDFGTVATLASGSSNSFMFSFTAPGTPGSVALTSNVTTTTGQGPNAAPDAATLNATVTASTPPANCAKSYYDNTNSYSGLSADYYSGFYNNDLTYFNNNTAKLKRVDGSINFTNNTSFGDLTTSGVSTATNPVNQNFSARYRGSFTITTAGSYTFFSDIDDNLQVWIDGSAVPTTGAPQTTAFTPAIGNSIINVTGYSNGQGASAALPLSAGPHNILIFYGAGGGQNNITLKYSGPDTGNATQLIPNSALCAGPSNVPPLAVGNTNAAIPGNAGPTALSPSLAGTDQDGTVTKYAVATLPTAAQGVLRLNGTAVALNQVITAAAAAALTFQPTPGFVGNAAFTFSAIDNSNQYSNTTATYTIPVTAAADVTTTLAGPTTLNPGQPSGSYTATFTNNGPNPGASVTQRVTLPAGVTNVVLPTGATYNTTTGVIDFGTATTLASGATNSFVFSFTAPGTPGSVALTSNVTTTTGQGPNAAPDAATLSATVANYADVAATIAAGAGTVTAGQTGTFNVTFINNGPATATGVTASVQLPAGLTGVTVTNNGTYDATTGLVSYPGIGGVVTGSGNRVDTKITFTAPASGPVTATASISTTTNEAGRTANNIQSAAIAITPAYDVATTISGPATTAVGVQTTFSVITSNNGPSVAPGVVQTVQLPANLTNVYVSNGGTYNSTSGVVTFPTLATLANGAKVDNAISFTPVAATGFTATATATANTDNTGDSNTANNTAAAAATAVSAAPAATTNANIYTTITSPSANVAPGATTTFAVTSGNRGPALATAVAQQTTLPAGLSNVVVKDANGNVVANTATTGYNSATGVVVVPATSVVSGATTSYTISLTAPAAGVVAAVATISSNNADPMPSDNIATADVTVNPATDVAIALTGPTTASAGQALTYTATTTNYGPVAATNVVSTVTIPAGLTGVTVSGGGTYNSATGVVSFATIASQAVGNAVSNTIAYTAPANGPLVNIATVASATQDLNPANNGSTVTTAVQSSSDVAVYLNGPATQVAGNSATYTVTTTNNGPSPAASETTTVQLVPGLANVVVRDASGNAIAGAYNATTGVVTLATLTNQLPGAAGTVSNTITYTVPAGVAELTASANAAVSGATNDANLANNSAVAIATVIPATASPTDEQTTVTANVTTQVAGSPVVFTVSSINNGPNAATNVAQTLTLPAGLTGVTASGGGTYDPNSGLVTFPAVASQASGNTTPYTVTVNAPGAGPLTAVASVSSSNPDPSPANNLNSVGVAVTTKADVAIALAGPTLVGAGQSVAYVVSVTNNGPSLASSTTTVQLLPGLTGVNVSGGGTYNASNGAVTFPAITNQVSGANGVVTYTISGLAPNLPAGTLPLTATNTPTAATNDPNPANNTATLNVSKGTLAPVANAVTNVLQGPEGNTANPLLISPLSGTDANGFTPSYLITSIPDATSQGVLALNGVAVKAGDPVTAAQASQLTFDPVATFVGNAFFTYTATDAAGVSAPAIYTIPVGQDLNAVYTTTPVKGGASPYQNGNVIANVFDPNSGVYNNAAPQAVTDTGVRSATLTSGPLPAGTSLDPVTGIITVTNRTLLRFGSYPVTITTVDANGGTNSNTFTINIGANPLPVELVAFTARAVGNRDAALAWTTASEKNSGHFDVERSLDGAAFVKIGQVQGQGSKASATDYALTDANAAAKATGGVAYYRLRQVDTDGTASYSPVQSVRFTPAAAKATLFPNPATTASGTTLDLSTLPAGPYQVTLVDMAGRTVAAYQLAGGLAHPLDLQYLASGAYVVLVRGTDTQQHLRLVKE